MTILDTHSESFVTSSGVFVSRSSPGTFSLQERFEGGGVADVSGILVCLIIAEKAEDEFLWSRLSPRRGTMTLVGDAVTHGGVVGNLLKDDNGPEDLVNIDDVF